MLLSLNTLRHATVAWLLAPLMLAAAESTSEMKKAEVKCDKPLAAVVIIDDQVNTSARITEQIRDFQLQTPEQALHKALL